MTDKDALGVWRGRIERVNDAQSQYFKVSGLITIEQTGESAQDVLFPCLFVERPRMSFMGELADGQSFEWGNFPRFDVVVLSWDYRWRQDGTPLYSGATLGIFVEGVKGQRSAVQWHAEGVGLQSPAGSEER